MENDGSSLFLLNRFFMKSCGFALGFFFFPLWISSRPLDDAVVIYFNNSFHFASSGI